MHHAHPQIAAFGGMFLLMLALGFFFDERAHTWLKIPEKILQKIGNFPAANAIISIILLLITSEFIAKDAHAVLFAGILGILTFMLVDGFGETMSHQGHSMFLFEQDKALDFLQTLLQSHLILKE